MKKTFFIASFLTGALLLFNCSGDKGAEQNTNDSTKTGSAAVIMTPLEEVIKAANLKAKEAIAPTEADFPGDWYAEDSTKCSFFGKDGLSLYEKGEIKCYVPGKKQGTWDVCGKWAYTGNKFTVTLNGQEKTYYVTFSGSSDTFVVYDPATKAVEIYERIVGC